MRQLKSLRHKFIRTMLLVSGLVGVSTLLIVTFTNTQASSQHLTAVQTYIEQGISSKGKVLTENHALALRGLTLDNAFLDMQRLVSRSVNEDTDVVYGLYVNSEHRALAFTRSGAPGADAAPPPDIWRALGFTERSVLVTKAEIQRTRRLGEDLLEVAVPVLGEEQEVIGTIRYGLSTQRMRDAIEKAESNENARLRRSLGLLASLVGVSSLLGLLLSRVQAVRITRPVADLTAAAEKLANGDRAVRVDVRSGDEIELLGASFNHMVEDLDRSYGKLEEMNRTLEQKVLLRTTELASKNRDMRLVLDNVDQGFITLAADGSMALERSAVVDAWFGECHTHVFAEYIGRTSRAFSLQFQLGWDQVVEDVLPVDVALSQLPERMTADGRTWSLRYLPFFKDTRLEGVLLVIADISERLAKEREEAEQGELMQGFKRLMLDRSGFSIFFRDASQMVEQICTRNLDDDMVVLKRTIHTLKGNSASMGMAVVARLCHALEEQLAQTNTTSDKTLSELFERWNAVNDHIAAFSGNVSQRVIEVPESEYASLVSRLSEDMAVRPDLFHQVLSWQLEPAVKPLKRLAEQAKQLARRLEKGELRVEVEATGVRLDPDAWSPFFAELTHVVRNAVDHGVEPDSERRANGKPVQGTLVLKAAVAASVLTFEIGDDGRGIDWEAIARKAKEHDLPHATQADLLEALCSDGISTRAAVSATSGRGVGMAAIRQRVRALGGRIEVRSVRNVGTHWLIRFPWSPQDMRAGRLPRTDGPSHPTTSLREVQRSS